MEDRCFGVIGISFKDERIEKSMSMKIASKNMNREEKKEWK